MAQVNREIEHPKLTNLKRAGFIIFLFSLVFTAGTAFLGVALIPDAERTTRYTDNMISGIAMYLAGPLELRLLFQAFVVLVGTLMLAGAVNTAKARAAWLSEAWTPVCTRWSALPLAI